MDFFRNAIVYQIFVQFGLIVRCTIQPAVLWLNATVTYIKWDWVAGMNNKGITQVGPERVNITTDGTLEIHKVNQSDTGQYMCTVKTINHSSPGIYHTTLIVIEAGKLKLCVWLLVGWFVQ